jgi:5-formyltetrahydrofolate cyclo-ligase
MMDDTKESMRMMIWDLMEMEGISKSPNHGRIPDFIGSRRAANLLKTTKEWEDAVTIFVSPDTAQRNVRENVISDEKILIIASPKLLNGYLLIDPSHIKGHEKEASTIKGAFKFGQNIDTFPNVDMVVEGSVAVDKYGGRLGKGGGYGDVEMEHLKKIHAINSKTPIVSTVHKIQIVDNVPLQSHDQKINMVVTPEWVMRIIKR